MVLQLLPLIEERRIIYGKEGKCIACNEPNPKISEVEELVKIYGTWIDVDSADGVSMYITWENNSEKEIKYITFDAELYNRVNDPLACNIRNYTTAELKQTGPFPQGKGNYICFFRDVVFKGIQVSVDDESNDIRNGWCEIFWENVWYNSTAHYAKIVGVSIEYMDGTTYSCHDSSVFDCLGIINVNVNDKYTNYA